MREPTILENNSANPEHRAAANSLDRHWLPVEDSRLSDEFQRRLARYMGEYDPSSVFASRYLGWYRDHTGRRSEWFRADLVPRLEICRPLKSARVLDFGCGTGSSAVVLAEKGAEVVGAETEQISLDIAVSRAKDLNVQDRCSFVRIPYLTQGARLPFLDASFDRCTLIGVLEHMKPDERAACAAEIRRVLRPGGDLFIFDTPNRAFPKDLHTTLLWFVGWLPESVARAYSVFRKRFDRVADFRRYGGVGISRRQIDRLFPPAEWSFSYEKSAAEIINEYEWLVPDSVLRSPRLRRVISRLVTRIAWGFLTLVKLFGGRPAFWTASHALCFRNLSEGADRDLFAGTTTVNEQNHLAARHSR